MQVVWGDGVNPFTVVCGDARAMLRQLPEKSAHACVTSPPYFNLRSYDSPPTTWSDGWVGALGLEPNVDSYIQHLVEVFRTVRRVLRDDGSLFVVIGDSYAGGGNGGGNNNRAGLDPSVDKNRQAEWKDSGRVPEGQRSKDLICVPWLLGLAMKAAGWYLRSDTIWSKANCQPESVRGSRWERCKIKIQSAPEADHGWGSEAHETKRRARIFNPEIGGQQYVQTEYMPCPGCPKCSDNDGLILRRGSWRPTRSHEYVLQFSKTVDYYSDGEAVKEPAVSGANGSTFTKGKTAVTHGDSLGQGPRNYDSPTRNKRSVWHLASTPFKEAHFATFPTTLVEPCILSSTSEHGTCSTCGAPYARVVERTNMVIRPSERREEAHAAGAGGGRTLTSGTMVSPATTTTGWRRTCSCTSRLVVPATVIDPFSGAGTTGLVARRLGRAFWGCDLNPDYVKMSIERIEGDGK